MPDSTFQPVPAVTLDAARRSGRFIDEPDYGQYALCALKNVAQDQVLIKVYRGQIAEDFYGCKRDTDKQSDNRDDVAAIGDDLTVAKILEVAFRPYREKEEQYERIAALIESIPTAHPNLGGPPRVNDDRSIESTGVELVREILELRTEWCHLRELILQAEDLDFTPEQSRHLAPRLIDLAIEHRDSNDPQDAPAVWSAIRTGASMMRPDEADRLRPLLEPGHAIETSLVTVKMIGRVFEAQPPDDVDGHPALTNDVRNIAESLLNPYAIASSQSAAMAQLAIYALAAMASTASVTLAVTATKLGQAWFTKQVARDLLGLKDRRSELSLPVAPAPLKLIDTAISALQPS